MLNLHCLKVRDKALSILTRKKRKRTRINKIRIERGEKTTDTKEIQGIVRKYWNPLYANKLDNLDKMDEFILPFIQKYTIFQNYIKKNERI